MISETTFARGYSSFWMERFPWLNSYVQSVNSYKLEKFSSQIIDYDRVEHRSINNVMAFIHFRNLMKDSSFTIEKSKEEALRYMQRFPRNNLSTYCFDSNDQRVVYGQISNLKRIPIRDAIFDPDFSGCGIIDNCRGDILQGNKLIEVKGGNRYIQPADIKQLIVYLALDWISSNKYNIYQVEIYNPRVGFSWTTDADDLFRSVTSFTKEEVLEQLTKYLVMQSEEMVIE
ncbi:hypothetical protein IKQ19_18745 [Candidatus Saccharibacteria bacterium]|nr:hypothetical protein [Candidatus Saccharibacteria bacterium]